LADGVEKHYNYILNWLAFRVQKPGEKNGKTLLFKSIQGTGKNTFFEWFGESIIGENHFRMINSIELLTGTFNSVIEGCLFLIGDEISNVGRDSAKIKNLLSQPTVLIHRKNLEPYRSPNLFQTVFLTNNTTYFNLENPQRRFVCFKASAIHRNDDEYFKQLKAQMNNNDCADHFYTWLLRRDISGFNDKSTSFPISDFHEALIEVNKTSVDLFIENYNWRNTTRVKTTEFYDAYKIYCTVENLECEKKQKFYNQAHSHLEIKTIKGYPHFCKPGTE
jgi:hypothetical protein